MNTNEIPPTERIAESYQQLSVASAELNAAADELAEMVASLESALLPLNLGVSAWHQLAGNENYDDGSYWGRSIGYAKIQNRWSIAIRRTWGNNKFDDHGDETWRFADAPRWMCIESAGKLPNLFDDLIKRTRESTQKLKSRTEATAGLVAAVAALAPEAPKKSRRGR